ncbi:hypothetical protein BOTBODRAFT_109588 [Botryobasidium botryosum FD-172 SS1]|uniref:Calcium-transporting ATPase n=1 Tax=Botryobasidium botryosum (strain FD-172 SS1) TaxID=930990 RepID=A0A067MJP9_BOTB1|nr:hypothetical protein BOTBODRAFT_109588 [Botryobasidium botryosum FD-172 SS1]
MDDTEPDHGPHALTPITSSTHAPSHRSISSSVPRTDGAATVVEEGSSASRPALQHIDPTTDTTDPTPFAHIPLKLASLVDPKNLQALESLGGVTALIQGLGTNRTKGLSKRALGAQDSDEKEQEPSEKAYSGTLQDRQRVYGHNVLPTRASKSLWMFMWLAFKDRVLILLSVAAVVSLALGLYQDLGTPPTPTACPDGSMNCTEPSVDWVEGVAIVVAILIVVIVGSVNDWQKEKQFRKLNEKKEDRGVKVIRHGQETIINIKDVLVGDVCLLEPGEIIPCDGVFLNGHNVLCDESGATGESDAIKKFSYEECLEESRSLGKGEHGKKDCFIVSGSKVLEGVGQYVVIAVGTKSFNGRIMMALQGDTEDTPLQSKLNDLAELIAKLGSLAGLILFAALMIRFFVQLKTDPGRTANEKAMAFVQILIIAVTLIVVAVPEGLPLAVTLALAFATKRMTKQNLLVRVLGSCETMANANVICTDKTGTLTQNTMTVVAGSVGIHAKFVQNLSKNQERSHIGDGEGAEVKHKHRDDFAVDMEGLNDYMSEPLQRVFNESIAVNSTAFEDKEPDSDNIVFVGSKTESALLRFAKDLKWAGYRGVREEAETVQVIPFSSERKAMGVVVKLPNGKYRFYIKGASETLAKKCMRVVDVKRPSDGSVGHASGDEIPTSELTQLDRENVDRTIIFYANQMLRTIAVCYRDFETWSDDVPYDQLANNLTLIAICGIEDPLRPGVREAVAECQNAGVAVKMCTGDNVLTARSIATQCGIYTKGGIIMEGPTFRQLSTEDRREIVPRLQVLARSSPEDKQILVNTLKDLGEVVGVTGDGTNDGPALKSAHVGFSMGIAGTEVAKEASDIILMDDNFSSIVSAIMWGRCVNDAVRKFLQFQISVNITAVIVTFVTAVASATETSALTAVQLLWINIIMDTFAALALATDPATPALLKRKPDRKTAPLFSVDMWKMIIGQSTYQTIIILVFHFAGNAIFGYHGLGLFQMNKAEAELGTLVFNAFVFCQIFNSINCRRIDNHLNVFGGILNNYYFIVITLLEIGIQILIVFVGGSAFQVTSMNGRDWGISIALGFVSLPLGALIRLIPNGPCERLFITLRLMPDPNKLPVVNPVAEEEWNSAVQLVRDKLNTFSTIRGARLRGSSFVGKSRTARLQQAGIFPSSLMTMVPTLIGASVGAGGWAARPGSLSDPAGTDPSRSSAALFNGQIQIHPETDKTDPFYRRWGSHTE